RDKSAATYLHARLPALKSYLPITTELESSRPISLSSKTPTVIDFSLRGDGISFLGPGWSASEYWGVWSLGPQAELALPLALSAGSTLRIQIEGRAAVSAANPTIAVTVRSAARILKECSIDASNPRVDMDLEPIGATELSSDGCLH